MFRDCRGWSVALALLPAIAGCSQQVSPLPAIAEATAVKAHPQQPPQPSPHELPVAAAAPANDARPAEEPAPFTPPFSDRTDPFQKPSVARTASADSGDHNVELKGFVNVAGLEALLVIDGEMAAVQPGEQYAGVEVVEIAPPQVTLQRGRARWTATLFATDSQ